MFRGAPASFAVADALPSFVARAPHARAWNGQEVRGISCFLWRVFLRCFRLDRSEHSQPNHECGSALLRHERVRKFQANACRGTPPSNRPSSQPTCHNCSISLSHCCVKTKKGKIRRVKYWEIIADNLYKASWSLGWVSTLDLKGRTIWVMDAHRGDGRRFVVRSDDSNRRKSRKAAPTLELRQARPPTVQNSQ